MATLSYSMVKVVCIDDVLTEIFELEASPEEGPSLHSKDKREKRKGKLSISVHTQQKCHKMQC